MAGSPIHKLKRTCRAVHRGSTPFALREQIAGWRESQFKAFREAGALKGRDAESFAAKSAVFISQMKAAHSFI